MTQNINNKFLLGIMMILSSYFGLMFTGFIASTTNWLPHYEYVLWGFCSWFGLGMIILLIGVWNTKIEVERSLEKE